MNYYLKLCVRVSRLYRSSANTFIQSSYFIYRFFVTCHLINSSSCVICLFWKLLLQFIYKYRTYIKVQLFQGIYIWKQIKTHIYKPNISDKSKTQMTKSWHWTLPQCCCMFYIPNVPNMYVVVIGTCCDDVGLLLMKTQICNGVTMLAQSSYKFHSTTFWIPV